MSKQIAVRLPDELVEFIDRLVESGQAGSRAVVVARALERERRRQRAAADVAILTRSASESDMDRLADFAARQRIDDLE